ncbi:MAG: AMP-binding protein [Ruminococcus sp.]|nr:AMP-binding protein [Ruminococcus sp.]
MNSEEANISARCFINRWQSGAAEFEAFTSGSTGKPKRIMLPRKLMEESARRSIDFFKIDSSSTMHLILSPEYIAGKMCIVRSLLACCTLTVEAPSSAPMSNVDTPNEITLLSAVGAQIPGMYQLLQEGKLPRIRHLLLGGSPLSETLAVKALQLAENVWESYGMTETASHIALRRISIPPGPFTPLENISVSTDSRGCLTIDMPTAGIIVTNDLADILPDGRFYILGRADNVLITGGLKVIPEKVERAIMPLLPDKIGYISSRPHPKWGEEIVLVLEHRELSNPQQLPTKQYTLYSGHSLYEIARELLAPHECPTTIIYVPKIKRTSTDKIIREKQL